jgi:phosphatidylglycerophosphate synthase
MTSSTPHAWIKPVPNLISAARIVLACYFPAAPPELRLALVVTAGVSDGIDGFIARHFRVTSWLGGLLDAAADKLFTLLALLTLANAGLLPLWQLPFLLLRDGIVALACAVLLLQKRWDDFKRMDSRWAGKATTFLLFGLMGAVLLDLEALRVPLFGLSFTASAAAAIDYYQSFQREEPESSPPPAPR